VRFLRQILATALAVFALITLAYGPDSYLVSLGRNNGQSWNLWKARNLDEAALRAHDGGRVTWILGSSILRESLDEKMINAGLSESGSSWRVARFGMTRGAAGLASGLLRRLPLRAGDRVVQLVSVANFRRDWIAHIGLPSDRTLLLLDSSEIWNVAEWGLPRRLEELSALPRRFYAYHEEGMRGLERWLRAPAQGELPKPRKSSFHIRSRKMEYSGHMERARALGVEDAHWMPSGSLQFDDGQFNQAGLQRIRKRCADSDVELLLIDIPARQEYQAEFLHSSVRREWAAWREENDVAIFPQLPEDDFYDLYHPNFRGREQLSAYLVRWLDAPVRGAAVPLEWPVPDSAR